MAGKVSKTKTLAESGLSFEERLEQLEALAEKMEQGQLPLQELLQDYEAGLALAASLEAELEKAKARMLEVKNGKGESLVVEPSHVVSQGSLLDGLEEEED